MLREEIDSIAAAADKKHKGDLTPAIGEFLGADFSAGVPVGFEAAHNGIKSEIEDLPNRLASENYDAAGGDNYTTAAALGTVQDPNAKKAATGSGKRKPASKKKTPRRS